VPRGQQFAAYQDSPLPIGSDQTISQPYIVALMTQLLYLTGREHVLEIGTGSGYQTAILCELAAHVTSIERFPELAERAARVLADLGYTNLDIHIGDGSQGLPDEAPFDAILVTAAAPLIPGPLRAQLHPQGGRLVLPIGDETGQFLVVVTRHEDQWDVRRGASVKFVPLVGRYGFRSDGEPPATV